MSHEFGFPIVDHPAFTFSPISIRDIATRWFAFPDPLLPTFPQSFDNVSTVFFGDSLPDLSNQNITPIIAVIERHVDGENLHAEPIEFIKEVFGNANFRRNGWGGSRNWP